MLDDRALSRKTFPKPWTEGTLEKERRVSPVLLLRQWLEFGEKRNRQRSLLSFDLQQEDGLPLCLSDCNSSDLMTPAIQTEKPHFFSVTGQQTDVHEIGISSPQQNLDPLQHLVTAFFDGDGPGSPTLSDKSSIRTALCKDRTQTELESFSNQKKMAESGVLSVSLRHCKPDRKPLSLLPTNPTRLRFPSSEVQSDRSPDHVQHSSRPCEKT